MRESCQPLLRRNASVVWLSQVLLAVCFSAVLTPAVAAQPADQEAPPPIFLERVDVNVVNIEVFVTDTEGRPVSGLTQDDFEVFEDGNPVQITNFFTSQRQRVLEELLETGELPERAIQSDEPKLLPADQRLSLVVYVDQFNLRPFNRNRVLDSLEVFLANRIRAGDNVMLVSAYQSPEVVLPFTRDTLAVVDGLRKMRKASTFRQADEARLRQAMRAMQLVASQDDGIRSARGFVRFYVGETKANVRRSAAALRNTVRSLGGLPGRKALLYVSEGLPQRPGEELYQQLQDTFGTVELRDVSAGPGDRVDPTAEALAEDQTHLFSGIVREANAHQVTFYTFDASGSTGGSMLSARVGGNVTAGNAGPTSFDNIRQLNLQQPLIEMAETTGGRSVLNTSDFADALDDVAANFDVFYSLGYSPPEGGDGDFHRIEVRLKNPGLKVRHRTGYIDKKPEEKIADQTISSLIFDLEKNPLGVGVEFGHPEKQGRNKYHLPVLVSIPIREVTLLPNGEQEEGRLKIYVAVKDDDGGISDLHTADYPVRIPHASLEEARQSSIGYTLTLLVRPGLPKVAVGVWDELSGTDAFVHKQVQVGEVKR